MPTTVSVPVSDPAHPSHSTWLQILLKILEAATAIGPAVVTLVSPGNAPLAQGAAAIAGAVETGIEQP